MRLPPATLPSRLSKSDFRDPAGGRSKPLDHGPSGLGRYGSTAVASIRTKRRLKQCWPWVGGSGCRSIPLAAQQRSYYPRLPAGWQFITFVRAATVALPASKRRFSRLYVSFAYPASAVVQPAHLYRLVQLRRSSPRAESRRKSHPQWRDRRVGAVRLPGMRTTAMYLAVPSSSLGRTLSTHTRSRMWSGSGSAVRSSMTSTPTAMSVT